MDGHGLLFRPGSLDPAVPLDEFRASGIPVMPNAVVDPPECARVELVGSHLRAEGGVDLGNFTRLSDYVNFLTGYFTIRDVTLLSRLGEPTRLTFPDLRVRLGEIAIVGQREPGVRTDDPGDRFIAKARRRLVVTTEAHIVYGYAYLHEQASLTAFVDATDPPFIPMTNVRVRWLADRRLAGRFPFALIQRSHVVAVATEISGGLTLLSGRGVTLAE
ncbi:MAG TPA: hypothetical protein VF323_04565 [Candidatus Limnocylindrales bacterium]